jgi:hypothetical protein
MTEPERETDRQLASGARLRVASVTLRSRRGSVIRHGRPGCVRQSNVAAIAFWQRVAHSWLGEPVPGSMFSAVGVDWQVFELSVSAGGRTEHGHG